MSYGCGMHSMSVWASTMTLDPHPRPGPGPGPGSGLRSTRLLSTQKSRFTCTCHYYYSDTYIYAGTDWILHKISLDRNLYNISGYTFATFHIDFVITTAEWSNESAIRPCPVSTLILEKILVLANFKGHKSQLGYKWCQGALIEALDPHGRVLTLHFKHSQGVWKHSYAL